MKVCHNGNLIPKEKANISITNKAYYFDFAVYSSVKVIKGKPFFLKYHVERLFESAKYIDLRHQFKLKEVISWTNNLIDQNNFKDVLLRMLLIGDVDNNKFADIFIFKVSNLTYLPERLYHKGAKVITFFGERLLPIAKTKNLLLNYLAFREAKTKNAIDALLIDSKENIREGTRSNFFAIKNNVIYTPPKNKVLEGVTKKIVLKIAKENNFKIIERDIKLKDIYNFDEIFITSTSLNVLPISQIDDIPLNSKFENTKKLMKLYQEYYHKAVFNE